MIANRPAAVISLVTFVALLLQWFDTQRVHSVGPLEALWAILRYFTILTNLAVALCFAVLATGRRVSAWLQAGLLLSILTVGIVYHLLLAPVLHPEGLTWWVEQGLHTLVPVLVLIYWLVYGDKAQLPWSSPWGWMLWPLGYCVYAIARGLGDGIYPYPFIDLGKLGWSGLLSNVVLLALAFIAAGYGLVAVTRRLARAS